LSKRGTPQHPKTYTLAAVLNVPLWGALGILESLWHFAQRYAPAGDVGRFTDDDIARAIGWTENAATLVSGLVQAGWLDRCSCHRARIHDWPDHADVSVKRAIDSKFLPCYQDPDSALPRGTETIASVSGKLAAVSMECIGGSTVVPAVAVAVPSLAIAKPKPESAPAVAVAVPVDKAWSAEAIDDHRELRGEPVAGKMLAALKPLVDRVPWPEVRPVWRWYLEADVGKFGAHNFAANFLAYQGQCSGAPARASPSPKAQERLNSASAFIRGGLIDRPSVGTGDGGVGHLPPGPGADGGDANRPRKRLPG
jgi:hypothetical protein